MTPVILLGFLIIFAVVLVAAVVGFSHFEKARKKQIDTVLQTVAGQPVQAVINVLNAPPNTYDRSLTRWLAKFNFVAGIERQLLQSGLTWTLGKFVSLVVKCGLGLGIAVSLAPINSVSVAMRILAGLALGGALPFIYIYRKRRKRLNACEAQLPDVLEFLARSMSAGHALTISLEMLGQELQDPLGFEVRKLVHEQNLGAPLELALKNLTERVPLLDLRFFAASVTLQKQTGGNLGEILMRLSRMIRERFQLRGRIKAVSAHGRITALILGVLPVLTMVAMLVVAPGYLQSMADDPDGKKLIAGAVVAQVIGNLVIRKITHIKV